MSRGISVTQMFVLGTSVCAAVLILAAPLATSAQTNVDAMANAMCNPVLYVCGGHNMIQGPKGCQPGPNMWLEPCSGPHVTGICDAPSHCLAQTFVGQAGQSGGSVGMSQLLSALQGLMSSLQGGGGSGGSGSGGSYSSTGSQGCTNFYQTSDPNSTDPCSYYVPAATIPTDAFTVPGYNDQGTTFIPPGAQSSGCTTYTATSDPNSTDPCTYYVPSGLGSNTSGSGDSSLPQVPGVQNGGCSTYTPTSDPNNPNPCVYYVPNASGSNTGTQTSSSTNITVNVPAQQGQSFFSTVLNTIVGMHGAGGDIQVGKNGETIYAGQSNQKTNSSVVGFYGGSGTQSQGLVGRLCQSRPWAKSFVSFLISPSFFDNLCSARGYHVGPLPPPTPTVQQVISTQPKITVQPTEQTNNAVPNYPPPQADIWASPSSVPIGGRTSIFWNARNVQSCIVTSPDGSFNETTISGGAATVPIVKNTIFTISCIAPDGSHVTNDVPVTISI